MDLGYYIMLNVYKWIPRNMKRRLVGAVPKHCQSQSVNKILIGCWPVRIGLPVWKKGNNWPCGFKASPLRWWKGIRGDGFKAAQRRTPIGPEAIWVKRESKGILQRGEIICWIFKIIVVSFRRNVQRRCFVAMKSYENKWNEPCKQTTAGSRLSTSVRREMSSWLWIAPLKTICMKPFTILKCVCMRFVLVAGCG